MRRKAWQGNPLGWEKNQDQSSTSERDWQDGAGGLLLVAAVHETGLLTHFESAIAPCATQASHPQFFPSSRSQRSLLLTLLFLNAVGLRRTRDLRGYTNEALGLWTGRRRAYSYWHTERFLTHVARAGGAENLTNALRKWTATVWQSAGEQEGAGSVYIDGHRKPVYADKLLPRGLIGCSGKILGCRALVLLHDDQGHPRLAMTHRGDQHLTMALPPILARYQDREGEAEAASVRVIVDREGMAAPFLRDLKALGHTVVTILRTDQYGGLESFTEVGPFVPLERDRQGQVVREVAPARYALPLPDQAGQVLPLRVALIRDLRRRVSCQRQDEETDEEVREPAWWQAGWKAEPTPATPTAAKLIPIVTTADTIDAVELAQTYTESEKQERYAHEQCDLLRALEDLAATERAMYELDNRKDHVMTVCKLALANVVMWTRDHYFPTTYAHATWARLAPLFHLRGMVVSTRQRATRTLARWTSAGVLGERNFSPHST